MAYERVNWEDYPSTRTPIDAEHLKHMDDGIADLDEKLGDADVSEVASSVTEAVVNIDAQLTANDGTKFQFAYDNESGRYGYIVESEGADTFFPFRGYDSLRIEDSYDLKKNKDEAEKESYYTFSSTGINFEDYEVVLATSSQLAKDVANIPFSATYKPAGYEMTDQNTIKVKRMCIVCQTYTETRYIHIPTDVCLIRKWGKEI